MSEDNSSWNGLCIKGCGFFGNAATGNMCSKCNAEAAAEGKAASGGAPPPAPRPPSFNATEMLAASGSSSIVDLAAASGADHAPAPPVPPSSASDDVHMEDVSDATPSSSSSAAAMDPSPAIPIAAGRRIQPPNNIDSPMSMSMDVRPSNSALFSASPLDAASTHNSAQAASSFTSTGSVNTDDREAGIQRNTNRCWVESCRKRVGLTGFKCKCGFVFCGVHRYADKHSCDFDYKSLHKERLREANPVVQNAKLEKI